MSTQPPVGQYVAYSFFRVVPAWRQLPVEERAAMKDAFAEVLESWVERFEHLRTYSTTGTTKASPYTEARRPRKIIPKGSPYLVVYPFVKVRPWYVLPLEERKRAMDEHIRIGREFETIHNHTTYSFGIDDQEFMTAFECDEPSDFMHLMQTLRESEASAYTERDTPIFVGEGMPIRSALDALDGASAQVRA
jgi:chlorite dismutase